LNTTPPAAGTPDALGSYLELERGPRRRELHPSALAVQSARAGLLALLQVVRPARIWIPWYVCETMLDPARMAGVPVARYGLDADFDVAAGVELAAGDVLVYVNYFGLGDAHVARVLRRFPRDRVIIDNSHALYARPRACLASLYSPRKFVGAPDGGYLVASVPVPEPALEDTGSAARCLPLLVRLGEGAEAGYGDYLHAERGLDGQAPLRMSRLTHRLLEAVDYAAVARRRQANFDALHRALGAHNRCRLRRGATAVPLSYPFIGGSPGLRQALFAARIYVPQYWPHLLHEQGVPEFERHLANDCIPLPCDQRGDAAAMARIADVVLRHVA
jgi:hypothetical protein